MTQQNEAVLADSSDDEIVPTAKYCIESIKKTLTPTGMKGDDWYKYVIVGWTSKITGFHSGSLQAVTDYVEDFAEGLNRRSDIRSPSPYSHTYPKKVAGAK